MIGNDPPEPRRGVGERFARFVVVPLVFVFVAIILFFYVLFGTATVSGTSMLPTLHDGDKLLVTRGYHSFRRGDIITTHAIDHGKQIDVVKRVIALSGDLIEIKADVAYVNGRREPEYGQVIDASRSVDVGAYYVPQGKVYVLGDNRAVSEDSRFFGPVALSGVEGQAVAIYLPVSRWRSLR